jgi:hypothetical protein
VADIPPGPNGYHIRVTASVDETRVEGPGTFWLACGVEQHEGHSFVVQFQVDWVDAATGQVRANLPDGLDGYSLTATSSHGSATCGYVDGALTCTYDKNGGEGGGCGDEGGGGGEDEGCGGGGMGDQGLKVPGLGSFTVVQTGVPAGCLPDDATLGTFTPRDIYGPDGPKVVVHRVVNRCTTPEPTPQPRPQPTTQVEAAAVTTTPTGTASGGGGALARTGVDVEGLVMPALALLLAGGALTALRPRDRARS